MKRSHVLIKITYTYMYVQMHDGITRISHNINDRKIDQYVSVKTVFYHFSYWHLAIVKMVECWQLCCLTQYSNLFFMLKSLHGSSCSVIEFEDYRDLWWPQIWVIKHGPLVPQMEEKCYFCACPLITWWGNCVRDLASAVTGAIIQTGS